MATLILGLIIFLGAHSARIVPGLQPSLQARMGELPYKGVYSVISLIGFVLIIRGYGQARAAGSEFLYDPPLWTAHIAWLLMVFAFIAFVAAYVPGRIKAALKHPMLVGVKLWAVAHLLSNGDVASVLLFGAFLGWAVLDRISVKRRERAGLAVPYQLPPGTPAANDLVVVVVGVTVYVAFLIWLHPLLIGVPAGPF